MNLIRLLLYSLMFDNGKNKISIYYQNVRGLRTKSESFRHQVSVGEFDIIMLTETWLMDGIASSEFFDHRYIVWRRDRDYALTGQTRGGGVLIATRSDLPITPQPFLSSTAEDLWLKLRLRKKNSRDHVNIFICVLYLCKQNRGLSFSDQLSNFLAKLSDTMMHNANDKFIVVGDFNMSGITWTPTDNFSLVPTNLTTDDDQLLVDELSTLGLLQQNGTVNKYGKLLDLVFSNFATSVSECSEPLVPIDLYHPSLLISTNVFETPALDVVPRLRYIFGRGDYQSINEEILGVSWEREFSYRSMDEAVEFFVHFVMNLLNKFVPKKPAKSQAYPVWYSVPLIKVIKEKYKYFRKFQIYGNKSDEISFKLLRDRVKTLESVCYKDYLRLTENSIKNNARHFWTFVKNRYNMNAIPNTLSYNNDTLDTGVSICEAFSSYFHSNFLLSHIPDISNSIRPISRSNYDPLHTAVSRICVRVDEVTSLLLKLDTSKGEGPDKISPKFLVKCAKSISVPISILFNKSLSSTVVPKIWKSAFITPVHKKGSKTEVTNYRPISKLCIIAKVFEKIIYNRVYPAIAQLLTPFQHGFLKGRSTTSNLILLNDFITKAMDDGKQVDVIYTDYSKAFDRIDHMILLNKLNHVGICGDLLRWFSSYIENRSQAVVLNNYMSKWVPVPSGVPQGSLLGPLLFIVYVNDIDQCLKSSKLLCFADDMKIFTTVSTYDDMAALQDDLYRLEVYCKLNKLDLNPSKCSLITYTRKRSVLTTSYALGGLILPRCNTIRDLGVYHDSKLIFDTHIQSVVMKASKSLGFIMRIAKCFTEAKTLKILYCTYVRSHLEYASQIWNPRYFKYIDRIENIQKRFIKYLCFHQSIPYTTDDYLQLCKKFHLLPLSKRREIGDYIYLLKLLKNDIDCPVLLAKIYFNIPSKVCRFNPPLHVDKASSNYRQNSYLVRASRSYNNILCKHNNLDPFITSVSVARRCLSLDFFR